MLKHFKPHVFLDLAGGYGQNKVVSNTWIMPDTPASQYGYANTHNNNYFASLTALYTRPWNNFVLSANGRLLYSQVDAGRYTFVYQPTLLPQTVAPLTNKVLFLMENAEIGYKFKPNIMPLMPFVNGGLIQVLHFSNSRPLINAAINGTLPQLSMNKNGYRLGGGLSFNYKQLTVRLEEQYYNASGTFTSYQTIAGLRYLMS